MGGGIRSTDNVRPPNVEDFIGSLCKARYRGTVVIAGGKIPQRLKEFRRKQQHEQTSGQSESGQGGAEGDPSQQMEADIERDHRDADGRKEFERRG